MKTTKAVLLILVATALFSCDEGVDRDKNKSPTSPANPFPADGAVDVSLEPTLQWTGGDPDGDPVTYTVGIGEFPSYDSIFVLVEDQAASSLGIVGLEFNTTYYWAVFAKDDQGGITEGPIWGFTTIAADPFEITFDNPVFTDIDITVDGDSRTVSVGGSQTFQYSQNPGSVSYSALTSGKTSQGGTIGVELGWSDVLNVSGLTTQTVTLNVGADFFFVFMTNNGTHNLTPIIVNWQRAEERTENILIPTDGVRYATGYFEAFNDTKVLGVWQDDPGQGSLWTQGQNMNIPFTNNQSVDLLNSLVPTVPTFFQEIDGLVAYELEPAPAVEQRLEPSTGVDSFAKRVE